MKKSKKVIIILTAAIICFSLWACSNTTNTTPENVTTANTVQNTLQETKTTEKDTSKPITESSDITDSTTKKSSFLSKFISLFSSKSENSTTQEKQSSSKFVEKTTAKSSSTAKKDNETTKKSVTQSTNKTTSTTTERTTSKAESVCYLTIECKSILENMDDLKAGHSSYVPKDGYILKDYPCKYETGSTAYDILEYGCSKNSIKLTAVNSIYGIYVSGINNLDEMDCGKESGWLYSVNGYFPNVSCNKYSVKQGDKITFSYTCSY